MRKNQKQIWNLEAKYARKRKQMRMMTESKRLQALPLDEWTALNKKLQEESVILINKIQELEQDEEPGADKPK